MGDPKNLDGSDSPSSIQAQPPQGYAKFKESLKSALLLLAGLDQASLATLKHDEEYQHAVQTFLVPLSSTPISEIIEEAMRSGLDAIVSHISTHLPARTTHPTPQITPSAQRSSTTTNIRPSFQAPASGGGEKLPSMPASSGSGVSGALGVPQRFISAIPGESQPRSTTAVTGLIQATSWQDRLQAAMRQRDSLPNNSQDNTVSVYLIHLKWRTWCRQNPAKGLVNLLNAKMDGTRRRRKMVFSPQELRLAGGSAVSPPFESQDRVIEAFTGQGGRTIVLVCPRQTSTASEQALLCDLQGVIEEIHYDLVRPWGGLTTQLAVSSIEWDLVMSVF